LSVRTVECLGDFVSAARSTVVFADALRAQPPPRGCFDPEEIWTLSDVEPELRAAGVTVVPRTGGTIERQLTDL
jgi:hypothetical protein